MTARWLKGFEQWAADRRWAANAIRARRMRREMGFGSRIAFDAELRPMIDGPAPEGARIAYPDALYHITVSDVIRAYAAARRLGWYS